MVWRVLLMPLDKVKTVLQVDGLEGFQKLSKTVMAAKHYTDLGVLFQGTMATIVVSLCLGLGCHFYILSASCVTKSAALDRSGVLLSYSKDHQQSTYPPC